MMQALFQGRRSEFLKLLRAPLLVGVAHRCDSSLDSQAYIVLGWNASSLADMQSSAGGRHSGVGSARLVGQEVSRVGRESRREETDNNAVPIVTALVVEHDGGRRRIDGAPAADGRLRVGRTRHEALGPHFGRENTRSGFTSIVFTGGAQVAGVDPRRTHGRPCDCSSDGKS